MAHPAAIDLVDIAREVGLPEAQVRRTWELLDEGNTIPFITRYRKDQTRGLDEQQIRAIQEAATRAEQLADRKAAILKSIESQGRLTPKLKQQIESARTAKWVEDLYLPYKSKKQTLATAAREKGLEPLAQQILNGSIAASDLSAQASELVAPEKALHDTEDVLAGVRHLIAEQLSERADVRNELRKMLYRSSQLVTCRTARDEAAGARSGEETASEGSTDAVPRETRNGTAAPGPPASNADLPLSVRQRKRLKLERSLRDYSDFREAVSRVPPHRVLAINRGERAKVLRVKLEGDWEAMLATAMKMLVTPNHPAEDFLQSCVRDALNRLLCPSLEREIRRELTERAEQHAVHVFAQNLRKLLLQPPVRGRRVLAIDPGFKSGCKLAALDEFGNVLHHDVIHIVGSDDKRDESRQKLAAIVIEHGLTVIAIGNGTGSRDTERLVADVISNELREHRVEYVSVNEAGASVYSTSALGREELAEYDALVRGAVSIGRRLLDPLSELVKINPANIGVGLYQHDVKAKHLQESLDAVVESCVNFVGVDVNTASPALLSYVSGLNQLTARRLYEHRREHGPFRSRDQLREVPGVGNATFVQAAGFLKITDGDNPLDATWVHPESYDVATGLLQKLDAGKSELNRMLAERRQPAHTETVEAETQPRGARVQSSSELSRQLTELSPEDLAVELGLGQYAVRQILNALAKPGRDPREDLPPPLFRTEILKLDDLQPGMELTGTVLNVVDFGAFVDIGISESALVHISRLADRYIRDPHEVVSIGDALRVWVLSVDKERRRVSLTAMPITPQTRGAEVSASSPSAAAPQRPEPSRSKLRQKDQTRASKQRPAKQRTKAPAPPTKPITREMVQGSEPMRSFSDLLQYYEVKQRGDASSNGE